MTRHIQQATLTLGILALSENQSMAVVLINDHFDDGALGTNSTAAVSRSF